MVLFYSQLPAVATTFSTQPLSPHAMRLVGLIFLLLTIINSFAGFETVEILVLKIFPKGTKPVMAMAAIANILFVVHYGFESFYYRDVNMYASTTEKSDQTRGGAVFSNALIV